MGEKKLVWQDLLTRTVLKETVIGHFAMAVVRQSPYLMPEYLAAGIKEFDKLLSSNIEVGNEKLIETTYIDLKKSIGKAISNSEIIYSWSIAKKGTGPVFVSSYSKPKPDYDFIDLDALARNIAQSVWLEVCYDDGFFK